jgi:hypothetical protein
MNLKRVFTIFLGGVMMSSLLMPDQVLATPLAQSNSLPNLSTPTDSNGGVNETISLPVSLRVATIPPAPQNPCPRIYYENPYNQYVVMPAVCTPNLITQQLAQMGTLDTIRGEAENQGPYTGVGGPYPGAPDYSPTPLPGTAPTLIPGVPSYNYNR